MPALEIVALDTATPQLEVPQSGDTYSAPRALAISPQSLTGASATTSLDIAQTWNTTGTPTAVKLNVTDTASNANSLLMDLGTGGGTFASKFSVRKDGLISVAGTTAQIGLINTDGSNSVGLYSSSTLTFVSSNNGDYVRVGSAGSIGFSGSTNPSAAISDTKLFRDNAANTLALRNATNAQTFNVYNTYTTTTNYERGFLKWNTNVLQIGTEKGSGGGTARALEFQTDGTTRLTIGTSGAATFTNQVVTTFVVAPNGVLFGGSGTQIVSSSNGTARFQDTAGTDFGRLQFGGTTSAFPALKRVGANLQTVAADDTATAGLIVGNQALATTATDGFLYVPTCAGTPTGTPTARTGTVPIVVDTTNNKLYFYSGAAWRDAGP